MHSFPTKNLLKTHDIFIFHDSVQWPIGRSVNFFVIDQHLIDSFYLENSVTHETSTAVVSKEVISCCYPWAIWGTGYLMSVFLPVWLSHQRQSCSFVVSFCSCIIPITN